MMASASLTFPRKFSLMQKVAIWQIPLVLILSLEIGLFLWLFWAASWAVSGLRRWWMQLPVFALFILGAYQLVPVKTADFFILLLVILLPFTWRIDVGEKGQAESNDKLADSASGPVSPAGLAPTIFLVGSVFIYQSQFIVLLGLVAWLLAFLLWYTMALTGFRLDNLAVRWLPIIGASVLAAGAVILLFSAIPRINTGFIPSFATASQQIGLTDELAPGGLSDLLESDEIAFRAVPDEANQPAPAYWRVFVLSVLADDSWKRVQDLQIKNDFKPAEKSDALRFQIVTDTHDLSVAPVPGWPADAADASINGYGFNRFGEAVRGRGADLRQLRISGHSGEDDGYAYPKSTALSDANPRLQEFGRNLRKDYPDDEAFIDAVMTLFQDEFTYDTSISLPQTDALDSFFFDTKRGYCSYFATSLATILRAGGLSAHVVTGYLGGQWNSFGNYWLVKQADAHAWVEVALSDGRWHRIDPTVAVMQLATPRFQGLVEYGTQQIEGRPLAPPEIRQVTIWDRLEQGYNLLDSLNLRVTLAIMNYGDDKIADDETRTEEDNFALVLAALGLAVTIIASLALFMKLSRHNQQMRPVIERKLEKLLSSVLGTRPPAFSLIRYAGQLKSHSPAIGTQAEHLAKAIYHSRFGSNVGEASQLHHDFKDLAKQLRQYRKQRPS